MLSLEARKSLEGQYNLLRAATDVIRPPEKWCVGSRDDGEGRHCALGALDKVVGIVNHHIDQPVVRSLAKNIPVPNDDVYQRHAGWEVAHYNNTSTHAEVIAWFENTANGMKCILDRDDQERMSHGV